jgi:peroxiredoxin
MTMARLKAAFPMLHVTLALIAMGHGAFAMAQAGPDLAWASVEITSASVLGFFAYLMQQATARTSTNLVPMLLVGIAATGASLWQLLHGGPWFPVAYTLGIGVVGQLLYVRWYSRFGRGQSTALRIGARLSAFAVEDERGDRVMSTALLGSPVVWLFFRGNWCPLCMAQIKEIAASYRQLAERGAVVALVSPQSHEQTQALAKRFDVPFRFFVDRELNAARALGIEHKSGVPTGMELMGYDGDTVFPTVIVTDARGVILACDQTDNYRVRPEPAFFLQALDGRALGESAAATKQVAGLLYESSNNLA